MRFADRSDDESPKPDVIAVPVSRLLGNRGLADPMKDVTGKSDRGLRVGVGVAMGPTTPATRPLMRETS